MNAHRWDVMIVARHKKERYSSTKSTGKETLNVTRAGKSSVTD